MTQNKTSEEYTAAVVTVYHIENNQGQIQPLHPKNKIFPVLESEIYKAPDRLLHKRFLNPILEMLARAGDTEHSI